jgi:hypothetical protein
MECETPLELLAVTVRG